MHGSQVSRHVVLPVELLVANGAGIGLALKVSGNVVAVEVAGMGVGVVANLTPVVVAFLDAKASDGDWSGIVGRTSKEALRSGLSIETGQL